MNFKWKRSTRVVSMLLAASVMFSVTAMAVDTDVKEEDVVLPVITEEDAPIEVGDLVVGTAMGIGTVQVLGVNVRENPNMDAGVVAMLAEGQQAIVLSKDGDWYRVACDGVTGFVHCDYMTVEEDGEADMGYAMIKDEYANVHAGAYDTSDVLFAVSKDDVLVIRGITDGWYKVTVNDMEGYILSDYVDPTAQIPAEKLFSYVVISCDGANLRKEPNADAEKVDMLYYGTLAYLWKQEGDWYLIQYGDLYGYILANLAITTNNVNEGNPYMETYNQAVERERKEAEEAARKAALAAQQAAASRPSSNSGSSSSSGSSGSSSSSGSSYTEPSYSSSSSSSIVSVAQQYMGVPYVWGGTSPSGFDCSGFTQYVFRKCGYSINRTADMQYYNGSYVAYSDLQAGDMVFFTNTYAEAGITHVGIYIGGGQFIHSASGGVKISSLSESYYSSRYYGARRVA